MNETRAGLEAVRRDVEEHMNSLGQRVNSVEDNLVDIDINKKVSDIQAVLTRSLNESVVTLNDSIHDFSTRQSSVSSAHHSAAI